jgi:hypothetical protein
MFHNQTRLQGDKQHYYEFNATGMGQFELNMNFLWIIQIPRIVFVLKMHLLIHLFILNQFWTGRLMLEKTGSYAQEFPRHRAPGVGLRVVFRKFRGLLRIIGGRRGIAISGPHDCK